MLPRVVTFRVVLDEGGASDAVHSLGGFFEGGGAARLLEEILGGDASAVHLQRAMYNNEAMTFLDWAGPHAGRSHL